MKYKVTFDSKCTPFVSRSDEKLLHEFHTISTIWADSPSDALMTALEAGEKELEWLENQDLSGATKEQRHNAILRQADLIVACRRVAHLIKTVNGQDQAIQPS